MPPKNLNRVAKRAAATSKTRSIRSSSSNSKTTAPAQAVLEAGAAKMAPKTTTTATSSNDAAPPPGPVYFWRPHDHNGYLGQWYSSEFTHEGCTYATAEMWMMVGKARLFGDEEVASMMLATTDPKTHKKLGREVRGFDEKVWNLNRLRIVEEGNYLKFTISAEADALRKMLLETGDRELVEASPMDRIWGVGLGEKNAGKNRHRWGLNLLGKALMNVRGRLREEEGVKEG
ncbi:DUF1768-domain-containing protein, partial [Lindgomyces ingoldianus]